MSARLPAVQLLPGTETVGAGLINERVMSPGRRPGIIQRNPRVVWMPRLTIPLTKRAASTR
jgi:hypothetical protein